MPWPHLEAALHVDRTLEGDTEAVVFARLVDVRDLRVNAKSMKAVLCKEQRMKFSFHTRTVWFGPTRCLHLANS